MYIKRKIEDKLLTLSDSFPVVIVTGARQVGKTTLLKHLSQADRKFVSLDIPENKMMATFEPDAFLQKYEPPVVIDEFQYAPELLRYIKAYVDNNKSCGDFWLTGSQSFVSMKNASESLAGRAGIINLYSLSNSEITGTLFCEYETSFDGLQSRMSGASPMSKRETFERILKGGMPRLYENFTATNYDYFSAYFQTYLSRDIKDLAQVADELSFYKFIQVCSTLAAKQISYTEISKRVGITANKAKQWMSILVSSGIIVLLQPYFSNALKRVVKTSKMYFMDTGLLCYLRGIESADALERSAESGDIFENYVVSEINKSYACAGKHPPLYYYRDANNRKEIDLLIERDGVVFPIEIKEGSNPDGKAAKNFEAVSPLGNIGTGNIICNCKDIYPVAPNTWAVPHWCV